MHLSPTFRRRLALLGPSVILGVLGVIASVLLYWHSTTFTAQKIRESMRTAVSLGAMQIHGEDLAHIQTADDEKKPVFISVAKTLRSIRTLIPAARFAYIFRQTNDPNTNAFVVDADAISTPAELDFNKNGKVDADEVAGVTGEPYDITDIPELHSEAYLQPTSTAEYTDQWGPLYSVFAPIRTSTGMVVATLGIDMRADDFHRFSETFFSPVALSVSIILAGVLAVYAAVRSWRRYVALLEQVARERAAVVRLTLHQVGAPLASLRWWLDFLKDEKAAKEDRTEAVRQFDIAIDRITLLLKDLAKATSMDQAAQITELRERVSVLSLMKDAEPIALASFASRSADLHLDLSCDNIFVSVHRTLIVPVLAELLQNALAYSQPKTPVRVHVKATADAVVISVEDQGIGIPEADLDHVFHEFWRSPNATKMRTVGNGLGLFIARKVISMHGGSIWVESTLGRGTTMSMKLPTVR